MKMSFIIWKNPFEFGALASIIFVGLNLKDEGLTIKGMTLKNFLPLIILSRKTCQMEVDSGSQKKGYLYFDTGVLLDAHYITTRLVIRLLRIWPNGKVSAFHFPNCQKRKMSKKFIPSCLKLPVPSGKKKQNPNHRPLNRPPPKRQHRPPFRQRASQNCRPHYRAMSI